MKYDALPTAEWLAFEADFLVSKDIWTAGLEDFLCKNTLPDDNTRIRKLINSLEKWRNPVLMDRSSVSYHRLGNLLLPDGGPSDHSDTIGNPISAVIWTEDVFVLRIRFRPSNSAVQEENNSCLQLANEFIEEVRSCATPSPRLLCTWMFLYKTNLESVITAEEAEPRMFGEPISKFGDWYRLREIETVHILYVGTISDNKPVQYRWYTSKKPTPSISSVLGSEEIMASIYYLSTRAAFKKLETHAEFHINKIKDLMGWDKGQILPPSLTSLIASLAPNRDDPLNELNERIAQINKHSYYLALDTTKITSLFFIFHSDYHWPSSKLKLARVGALRGQLIDVSEGEVGKLSLSDYYRRSAQQIEGFYRQRFSLALKELDTRRAYLQAASSVRSEQRSNVLNKLVLILTIVSAALAILQVITAIKSWNTPKMLGICTAGLVITIMLLVAMANWRIWRMQSSHSSETSSQDKLSGG